MKKAHISALLLVFILLTSFIFYFTQNRSRTTIQPNILPKVSQTVAFNDSLQEYLNEQFQSNYEGNISVQFEFLREEATQTGNAYPKYYLWVIILDNAQLIDEGAIRLALLDQNTFEITHYITKSQMKEDPTSLEMIFPKEVVEYIKQRF